VGTTAIVVGGKNCCTDKAVCIKLASPGSVIIWMFLAGLVLWMLENLTVVVLVNCLASRNKFLVNSAVNSQTKHVEGQPEQSFVEVSLN
jgi:hypothetical protein